MLFGALVVWIKKISLPDVGIQWPMSSWSVGMALGLGFAPILLFVGVAIIGQYPDASWISAGVDTWVTMAKKHPLDFLMLLIVAPIAEEFFFRGLVLQSIEEKKGIKAGILFSALFFMAAHSNLWLGPLILSLINGYMFWKSRSLVGPILLHMLSNTYGLLLLALPNQSAVWFEKLFL
ncbi:MAG: CPBP family intramembrane glutamic endopeptidase [Bdellovibrionota bacterium]